MRGEPYELAASGMARLSSASPTPPAPSSASFSGPRIARDRRSHAASSEPFPVTHSSGFCRSPRGRGRNEGEDGRRLPKPRPEPGRGCRQVQRALGGGLPGVGVWGVCSGFALSLHLAAAAGSAPSPGGGRSRVRAVFVCIWDTLLRRFCGSVSSSFFRRGLESYLLFFGFAAHLQTSSCPPAPPPSWRWGLLGLGGSSVGTDSHSCPCPPWVQSRS